MENPEASTTSSAEASTESSAELRRRLVQHLRLRGFLHDARIAEAFLAVPREFFLSDYAARAGVAAVYSDEAIVIQREPVSGAPLSSSSQPAIMSLMLEMLDVRPGHRVLEIGAGTGYNAALLQHIVGAGGMVVTIDIEFELAARSALALAKLRRAPAAASPKVHVVVADGRLGLPGAAPLDRIEATASSCEIHRPWYEQLVEGGKLVVPLRLSATVESTHAVTAFEKVAGGFDSVAVTPGGFMPLRGPAGAQSPESGSEPSAGPPLNLARDAVGDLQIAVRYGDQPPNCRWVLRRSDHWIGID